MKNFIFKIIALVLIAVMCLGTTACSVSFMGDQATGAMSDVATDTNSTFDDGGSNNGGTNNGTTNNGGTNNGGETAVKGNEEKLFAELLKAYKASVDYKGALTMKACQSQT